ncbi:MAG: dihydropteroate synthase [Pseudomonadota bacterium]
MSERSVTHVRPLPCEAALPGAWRLAGTALGFREVALLGRGQERPEVVPVEAATALGDPALTAAIGRAAASRDPVVGLSAMATGRPAVMGIVNVTPDSFSDGGLYDDAERAIAHGHELAKDGADILDIGGESTRPGATPVPPEEERSRVIPVIEGLRRTGLKLPISIDTRNAETARAALDAGADLINDVSALTHDPRMPDLIRERVAFNPPALCLMHALGDPQTMQLDPRYSDVLLDVYDFLEQRLQVAEDLGIPRSRVLADPGIGFGKNLGHNLALIRGFSIFHTLGAPLLLGVSRKRFIGTIGGASNGASRMPGSLGASLFALSQGVHVVRVHDVAETVQAIRLWYALTTGWPGELI